MPRFNPQRDVIAEYVSYLGAGVTPTPQSIDAYLERVDPAQRSALERLRRAIKAAVPKAEECISYQVPAFRLDGTVLVWFGAASKHCSFYPGAAAIAAHEAELAGYKLGKGTIRFPTDAPIPAALVRKLVKTRIAAVAAKR